MGRGSSLVLQFDVAALLFLSFHGRDCHFGKCEFPYCRSLFGGVAWGLLLWVEQGAIAWRMHCPKLVSGAPVVLFALKFLFDWLSIGWGDNFPFSFSTELV
jgi:hypothetical protein